MFNNQYPFYENHSLKVSYIYGERYLDKVIKEACIKLVCMDIYLTDDYTVLFPEGTSNIDLNAKVQKLDEEVKRMLIPYQETIIVAGMGGWMIFQFMEAYCKRLAGAYKDLEKSTTAAIGGEKNFQEQLVEREKALAEIDGIPMEDEDVEQNVAIQVESSPYRRKVNEDIQRVLKVMSDG